MIRDFSLEFPAFVFFIRLFYISSGFRDYGISIRHSFLHYYCYYYATFHFNSLQDIIQKKNFFLNFVVVTVWNNGAFKIRKLYADPKKI